MLQKSNATARPCRWKRFIDARKENVPPERSKGARAELLRLKDDRCAAMFRRVHPSIDGKMQSSQRFEIGIDDGRDTRTARDVDINTVRSAACYCRYCKEENSAC
jgi:hypothetical protein